MESAAGALDGQGEKALRAWARLAGALYLFIIIAGTFAEAAVRSRLVVGDDAMATAANIAAHPLLLRIGFSAEILMWVADVALVAILFVLLRRAGVLLAGIMALLRLACVLVLAVNALNQYLPLLLLGGAEWLGAFDAAQRAALVLLSMKLHGVGYAVALVFFGAHCLLLGWLLLRSRAVPAALGILLAIAGACYLVNSFAVFLSPALARLLFPAVLVPCFVAELAFALWLLVRGIRVPAAG